MFELPELVTLASQINATMRDRTIRAGALGNRPHKFVWYNRTHAEFAALSAGKRIGQAHVRGRWLFVALEPGFVLAFGECGGRMLFHEAGSPLPEAFHLALTFDDGAAFTLTTAMWGAMELHEAGAEQDRASIRGMRPTPLDPEFTFEYFCRLIDEQVASAKRSAKGLLTQEQLVPGLGNAIAQDILFRARLDPRHGLAEIDAGGRRALYSSIVGTIDDAIALGGRNDETDLFGAPGRYVRLMDKSSAGHPCPRCGTSVLKIQYLGGACYFCPGCQVQ